MARSRSKAARAAREQFYGSIPEDEQARSEEEAMRASIVHGLRSKGWSRIEAENEADDRIENLRARRKEKQEKSA